MVNKGAAENFTFIPTRREAWRSEIETQRKAILRDCPRAMAVDRAHALTKVAGVMQGGEGSILAQRYILRGLLGDGFSRAEVARALRATPEQIDSAMGDLPIYAPGAKKMQELLERVMPVHLNAAGYEYSSPEGDRRQGNVHFGSRGWRTPGNGFPQTRDYRPT